MIRTCPLCSGQFNSDYRGKAPIICGSSDCLRRHNELASERRSRKNAAPPRKRQPRPLYGDFAYIAMLNGVSTDGTGRKVTSR